MLAILKRASAFLAAGLVAATVFAACGDDDTSSQTTVPVTTTVAMDDEMATDGHTFDWGTPADAASADRVIEIDASDSFRFDPAVINVKVGETITFRVTNSGAIQHEFVVGTADEQAEHEEEMEEMGDMAMEDEPNAIIVEAGETKDLTLTLTTTGALQFACHVTGHFAAGMVGDLGIQP